MSSVATKNLTLFQPKAAQIEIQATPTLAYTTEEEDVNAVHKIEIPGVDPSTVEVDFEGGAIEISCERGRLSLPVPVATDTSKIKAEIQWGVLTLTVPLPPVPAPHRIRVSIQDSVKQGGTREKASKAEVD